MFTFDVVSESVRNPHELAAELTRRSREGWEVMHIVYDGHSWFHAFIRHAGSVEVAPYPTAKTDHTITTVNPGSAAAQPVAATPASSASASSGASGATGAASNVPNPPANWYPDPSGRFERRYWNGSKWTEHVANGQNQAIDPPK